MRWILVSGVPLDTIDRGDTAAAAAAASTAQDALRQSGRRGTRRAERGLLVGSEEMKWKSCMCIAKAIELGKPPLSIDLVYIAMTVMPKHSLQRLRSIASALRSVRIEIT